MKDDVERFHQQTQKLKKISKRPSLTLNLLVSFPYFQHGEWMFEGGGKKQRWSIHLLESVKG